MESSASHTVRKTWANLPDLTVFEQRRPVFQLHDLLHAPRSTAAKNHGTDWHYDAAMSQSDGKTPGSTFSHDMNVCASSAAKSDYYFGAKISGAMSIWTINHRVRDLAVFR